MKFELIHEAEYIIGPSFLFSNSTLARNSSKSWFVLVCSLLGTQEVTIISNIKLRKFFIYIPRY